MSLLSLLCSLAVAVPELPPSEYADTEATTNIPVTVRFDETSRLCFTLSLAASPTNALVVSIGSDADRDGRLAPEECDYAFGYDCGTWFVLDGAKEEVREEKANGGGGRLSRTFLLLRPRLKAAWDLVRVTRRGTAGIADLTKVEGRRPGLLLLLR